MRKYWIGAAVFAALCIAAGLWWDLGHGQHWLAYQTGTYCGTTGTRYCYWSGFGSVFPWVAFSMGGIFAGLAVGLRKVNCHQPGCPRIGRYPDAGGSFHYCGKHHPGWEGKHPSQEHRDRMHHLHMAAIGHPDHKADH